MHDPDVLTERATMLAHAYEQGSDIRLMLKAVELFRMAVDAAPYGNPDREMYLHNLTNALVTLFEANGDLAALREAIQAGREAMSLQPSEASNPSVVSNALGLLHRATEEPKALDEAVRLALLALRLTPAGDRDHPMRLSNLAGLFQMRYLATGDTDAVTDGIETGRAARALARSDHDAMPAILGNMGILLRHRFEIADDPADLTEAHDLTQDAISRLPRRHADRGLYLANLATIFGLRYESDGRRADLDTAFGVCREALALTPTGHPGRPGRLSVYANLRRLGQESTGDAAQLDAAIDTLHAARAQEPRLTRARALVLATLALSLQARYEQRGQIGDLTEAIDAVREALSFTAEGDPERPARLASLGVLLRHQYKRTSRHDLLLEAVEKGRESVAITPPGHRWRVGFLNSLANALLALHTVTGDGYPLAEAIALTRTAAQAARPGTPGRAILLNGLANALLTSYTRTGDLAELAEAIARTEDAIADLPDGHPDLPLYVNNLSNQLRARHERTGDDSDLSRALAAARTAVAATSDGHPLRSGALANLAVCLAGTPATWAEAVAAGRESLTLVPSGHRDRIDRQCTLGRILRSRFEHDGRGEPELREAIAILTEATRTESASPRRALLARRLLAQTLMLAGDREPAMKAYAAAIDQLAQVAPLELTREDRQHGLGELPGLAGEAASVAIANGRPDYALQLLEQARGVLLSEIMVGRGELARLDAHPALANLFRDVRKRLDTVERDDLAGSIGVEPWDAGSRLAARELAERRGALAAEWNEVLTEIRAIRDLDDFLLAPSARKLGEQAAEGPIVVINTSRFRCDALVLTSGGPVRVIELPELTHRALIDQANRFRGAIRRPTASAREILAVLDWMWETAAGPVMAGLDLRPDPVTWPRLWWCPVGEAAFLPWHAAGRHETSPGDTVLDRVISSYTPTIRALRHAREQAATAPGRTLLIAQPETPGADPIPGTLTEVTELAKLLPGSSDTLIGAEATHDTVLRALPAHPVVHLACHGISDWNDPAASRLLLHDHLTRPLTVAAISRQRLPGAELAFLSACSTTVANQRLADEAVHITVAFQLAGFRRVIGTLWKVKDDFAASTATAVYGDLTHKGATPPDPSRAAVALHGAVRELRDQVRRHPGVWAAHIHVGA